MWTQKDFMNWWKYEVNKGSIFAVCYSLSKSGIFGGGGWTVGFIQTDLSEEKILLSRRGLTSITLPYYCACPYSRPRFLTPYVVIFAIFNDLRWEAIVRFVNIGEFVDHHCLFFLFIVYMIKNGSMSASKDNFVINITSWFGTNTS